MQYFQPILIVIGVLAIAAVLIHGYLISRKEKVSLNSYADSAANISKQNSEESDDLATLKFERHIEQNDEALLIDLKVDRLEAKDFVIEDFAVENDHHSMHIDSMILTDRDDNVFVDSSIVDKPQQINEEIIVQEALTQQDEEQSTEEVQDIFIFNVVAKEDGYIQGHRLLQFFLTAGFRFGQMDIFHRHVHSDGTGPILFSIANMMAPGVFNPVKMKQFHSEGVSFFLTAPNNKINIKEAFDMMLVAVQQMADEFDCVVLNSDREPMTEQQFRDYQKCLLSYS